MKRKIVLGIFLLGILAAFTACSSTDEDGPKGDPAPVPVQITGHYEENAEMMIPNYTYNLKSVHEVDGRQGISYYKNHYYVSDNKTLSVYDSTWKLLDTNASPFDELGAGVNHIGDIDVYDGEIFAGVEYFRSGDAKHIQIAVYNADNLCFLRSYPIVPESKMTEISGITVDDDDNLIWVCSWADDNSGKYLYAYNLVTGIYVKKVQLLSPPRWIQGIAYDNGWIYMTSDDGDADKGEPDHVYRCKVELDTNYFQVVLERTIDDVELAGEIEGISFDRNRDQMLISNNRGRQIVDGMPKGYYEGYDKEIHEIYLYGMTPNEKEQN